MIPNHRSASKPLPNPNEPIGLAHYISITADWEKTNARWLELIERKLAGKLEETGKLELARLKKLAWAMAQLVRPLPLDEAKATEMGYPTDLPDLTFDMPPRNRRPGGISDSCRARLDAGDLPTVY